LRVTYVAVPGARHDVVLSSGDVRVRVYEELERCLTAYVDQGARAARERSV
jgi:hypothetical protein